MTYSFAMFGLRFSLNPSNKEGSKKALTNLPLTLMRNSPHYYDELSSEHYVLELSIKMLAKQ